MSKFLSFVTIAELSRVQNPVSIILPHTFHIVLVMRMFSAVYDCDLFQVLKEHIECFKYQGHVILTGDFNGRVGFIDNDNTRFGDISCVPKFFDYENDVYCKRNSEDEKVNTIGRLP